MFNLQEVARLTVDVIREEKTLNPVDSRYDDGECMELSQEEESLQTWRKRMVRKQTQEMLNTSSLHGLPHIFAKQYPIRRFMWFCVTVMFFGYSVQKVYESTVRYFEYPFNTARMRKYVNQIDFPAVSFCNLNDIRLSVMNGTRLDRAVLYEEVQVTSEEYYTTMGNAQHRLEDMLIDCKFNGQSCSFKNFTTFYWQAGDKCYTFNSGKTGHKILSIDGAGLKKSLVLTINIQHFDYYRDVKTAGMHLIVHGQLETPVKLIGDYISPGYTTYLEVKKRKIKNLKAPYKTKCGFLKLKYFESYSLHTCWLEKLTDFVYKNCSCKDFFMPGDLPTCNLTESTLCMWPMWGKFSTSRVTSRQVDWYLLLKLKSQFASETFQDQKLYKCPLPCEIESFHVTSSRSLLSISPKRLIPVLDNQTLTHMKEKIKNENIDQTQFLRDNLIRVVVYYDDLSYELLEQQPSYDTLVWLGDVGGQVGLFVGAGALSYFELLDSLLLIIYTYLFSKKNEKYLEERNDTDDENEANQTAKENIV